MIKKVEFEAKNFDDAMNLAVDLLKVPSDKIYLTELGANGDEIMVEAIVDINLALEGKRYLESLLKCLNVEYKIEVRTLKNETEIYYNVFSENNPVLIGTYGRCLDAIQTLVRACIQTFTDEHIIVSVDIDDYKEKRKRQLEILATKVAKEVAKTKVETKLKPMNAFERRVIHAKLSDWRDVYTESEGEGKDRCLVIKPVKK